MTGEEFRARRKALGMSQAQLARHMGYCEGTIRAYELGKRRITDTAETILTMVEAATAEKRRRIA